MDLLSRSRQLFNVGSLIVAVSTTASNLLSYPVVRVALGVAQRLQWHPGGCQHTFLEVAVALTCHRTSADLMAWWMLGQISANRPPDHSRTRSDASNVDILTTGTDKDIFDSCDINGLL